MEKSNFGPDSDIPRGGQKLHPGKIPQPQEWGGASPSKKKLILNTSEAPYTNGNQQEETLVQPALRILLVRLGPGEIVIGTWRLLR